VAALTPLLGVPVYGRNIGHDANFALTALAYMDAGWAEGRYWPRWVLETNFGLGGGTFTTYPPLAYWAAALLRRVTGLGVEPTLALAMGLWRAGLVLTGFLWLRRHVPPGPALAGAALAALLPYAGLVNPWIRFSYAEVAGAALLPLLLLAAERTTEGRRGEGIAGLAVVFAALAMTHLPGCVLAAHLVPAYAWALGGPRAALRVALGGVAGAGLAACFLLPAAGLLREMNFEGLEDGTWTRHMLGLAWPDASVPAGSFLLGVWAAAAVAVMAALGFAWLGRGAAGGGLRRAALVLLGASAALMTVLTWPAWVILPQLRSVEFPWRAAGMLGLPLGALAALALAAPRFGLAAAPRGDTPAAPRGGMLAAPRGGVFAAPRGGSLAAPRGGMFAAPRRGVVAAALGLGLACAIAPPAWLAGKLWLGDPAWPRFLPAEERLARALGSPRGTSPEHLPAAAAAAGWRRVWDGTETAPAPDAYPRPAPPAGARRIPGGWLVPLAETSFTLPQFWYSGWRAADAAGRVLPVRPTAAGLVEVVVDRPVHGLTVRIAATPWEWAGWAVTGLTAAGLLGLVLVRPRRPVPVPAPLRAG